MEKRLNLKNILLNSKENIVFVKFDCDMDNFLDSCASIIIDNKKIICFLENNKTDRENILCLKKLKQITTMFDTILIVKSRFDYLKLCLLDGILLDYNSASLSDIKKWTDKKTLFGFASDEFMDYKKIFDDNKNIEFDFYIANDKIIDDIKQKNYLTGSIIYNENGIKQ